MVETIEGPAPGTPPPPRPGTRWGDRVRFVLRGIGQTLITAGVIVLLFVVYEVYVTNYFAHQQQHDVKNQLRHQLVTEKTDPLLQLPGQTAPKLPDGKGIAFLYIPRLGSDFAWAIVQGTSDADLEKGPGHYQGTALPGEIGNFGVAGHRVGKGEPFLNLDHLRVGDPVIVQTQSEWYIYQVLGGPNNDLSAKNVDGVPGREIVNPGDGNVLLPVPDDPGTRPQRAYLTMTTCHPKFTAAKRMIVHAQLVKSIRATGLKMPAAVTALYKS